MKINIRFKTGPKAAIPHVTGVESDGRTLFVHSTFNDGTPKPVRSYPLVDIQTLRFTQLAGEDR